MTALRRNSVVLLPKLEVPTAAQEALLSALGEEPAKDILAAVVVDQSLESVKARVASTLRSPKFSAFIDDLIKAEIETLVRAELAKRADELEGRIRAVVNERFEEEVASTARRLLEEELAKIRRRFS